jgi:phosphoenolpyruvate carboxylase
VHRLEATRASSIREQHEWSYASPAEFVDDLQTVQNTLRAHRAERVASGDLQNLLWRARTFGFHLAKLDVRQESDVHAEVVAELFRRSRRRDDYGSLDEDGRVKVLIEALEHPAAGALEEVAKLDNVVGHTAAVFERLPAWQRFFGTEACDTYVISLTHGVSDVLEVVLLAKEAGLVHLDGDRVVSNVDVVPLFELIPELESGGQMLDVLLGIPAYRA